MFPNEFVDVLRNNKKLENHSQRLFDLILNKLDDTNKVYMWPALTALLIISNDKMQEAENSFGNVGEKSKRMWKKVCTWLCLCFEK